MQFFCSMTKRQTNQVDYILDAYKNWESFSCSSWIEYENFMNYKFHLGELFFYLDDFSWEGCGALPQDFKSFQDL